MHHCRWKHRYFHEKSAKIFEVIIITATICHFVSEYRPVVECQTYWVGQALSMNNRIFDGRFEIRFVVLALIVIIACTTVSSTYTEAKLPQLTGLYYFNLCMALNYFQTFYLTRHHTKWVPTSRDASNYIGFLSLNAFMRVSLQTSTICLIYSSLSDKYYGAM